MQFWWACCAIQSFIKLADQSLPWTEGMVLKLASEKKNAFCPWLTDKAEQLYMTHLGVVLYFQYLHVTGQIQLFDALYILTILPNCMYIQIVYLHFCTIWQLPCNKNKSLRNWRCFTKCTLNYLNRMKESPTITTGRIRETANMFTTYRL